MIFTYNIGDIIVIGIVGIILSLAFIFFIIGSLLNFLKRYFK